MLPYENVLDHPLKPGNKDQMIWQVGDLWAHARVVYSNIETVYNSQKKYDNYLCPFLLSSLAF